MKNLGLNKLPYFIVNLQFIFNGLLGYFIRFIETLLTTRHVFFQLVDVYSFSLVHLSITHKELTKIARQSQEWDCNEKISQSFYNACHEITSSNSVKSPVFWRCYPSMLWITSILGESAAQDLCAVPMEERACPVCSRAERKGQFVV